MPIADLVVDAREIGAVYRTCRYPRAPTRRCHAVSEEIPVRVHPLQPKVEVDGILEAADGRIIGIEVKAGSTIRSENLAGLRHLEARLGERFIAGYVLYTGQQTLPYGDRLHALPIDAIWNLEP